MLGSFAVLTQRGPFSRSLLTYDLDSVEARPTAGTWYLVPFMHDVAPALLVSTSLPDEQSPAAGVLPLPVLSPCHATGIYPDLGPAVIALQHALERQLLGWEDALAIVRFLQTAQRHDRHQTRLTSPEPSLLLHNLQVMAARDATFATRTNSLRQLLSDDCTESQLGSSLWKLSTPTRRHLYDQGAVVDIRLADAPARSPIPVQTQERVQLLIGSFSDRAARIHSAVAAAIAAGGSVVLVVSSDILCSLYEKLLADEWKIPVVRWPTAPVRKLRGERLPTVWLSTRQFSAASLPETALFVVDLGVPGEWPFFWQRFSLRSLLSVVADLGRQRGVPCLVGVSAPTLSILDVCGIPLESAPQPIGQAKPIAFVVRTSDSTSPRQPGPSGILLEPTMRMLRKSYDAGSNSVLLLNIRGLATLIECAECGYTATCPACGATLTLGADRAVLYCKQCGHSEHSPDVCPNCHGSQLRSRGYGLDRLARELRRTFPSASIVPMDSGNGGLIPAAAAPSLFLGTYADVQLIASLRPGLVVFPDVSVGLRQPVFDNVEQLAVVVRGAAAETTAGTVLVQLDRRTIDLRSALDTIPMTAFLEIEQAQRRELLMPPFARQFVIRLSTRSTDPDIHGMERSLVAALTAEGVNSRGLHTDLLAIAPGSRVISLEFRVDARESALGLRVGRALSHNRLFQNAGIRIY
ncbi:MAG: hypothetical protein ACYDHF_04850 [Candidatus Cryosericum sp.]